MALLYGDLRQLRQTTVDWNVTGVDLDIFSHYFGHGRRSQWWLICTIIRQTDDGRLFQRLLCRRPSTDPCLLDTVVCIVMAKLSCKHDLLHSKIRWVWPHRNSFTNPFILSWVRQGVHMVVGLVLIRHVPPVFRRSRVIWKSRKVGRIWTKRRSNIASVQRDGERRRHKFHYGLTYNKLKLRKCSVTLAGERNQTNAFARYKRKRVVVVHYSLLAWFWAWRTI